MPEPHSYSVSKHIQPVRILFLSPLLLFMHAAIAADLSTTEGRELRASQCPPGYIKPLVPTVPVTDTRVHVSSDQAQIDNQNVTTFSGTVSIKQGDKSLQADSVRYDRSTDRLQATGSIIYTDTDWQIEGKNADFNLNTSSGSLLDTHYSSYTKVVRGEASKIEVESKEKLRLEHASYTSCPRESKAWQLSANSITLDYTTHQGHAESVTLDVMGVPVLFLPYMRFPLGDERMSGFLFPSFGTSKRDGTEINIPFYWNIAPQYDMTINPHFMSNRGWMLETEFRYLQPKSNGELNVNVLPNDKLFGDQRDRVTWNHTSPPEKGWSSRVSYDQVSDTQYINDFTNTIALSSITHLDRRGEVNYNAPHYLFGTVVQDYQTLTGNEPYKRLPQVTVSSRFSGQKDNTFVADINSELVRFDHNDPTLVIGDRLRLNPYISYPWYGTAGYVTPKVSVYQINYHLDHIDTAVQSRTPSVTVPVYSLDAGMFMENETRWGDTALLQTLEPRLYYLYAPYRDQSTLPNFDTGLATFNEITMFSENRFTGGDRVGDANQLAAAVTSRLYRQDNGFELLAVTLGEQFYFQDRQVTPPAPPGTTTTVTTTTTAESTNRSSLFGTLSVSPDSHWRMRGDIQWNTDNKYTEVGNLRVQYRPETDSMISLDYRFRRNELRTYGASTSWRFSPHWRAFGGHQFDLENNHKVENFLGIQYDSCCWAARLFGVERLDTINSTPGNPLYIEAVFLSIELKGLADFGQQKDIDTLLGNSAYGYSR